MSGEEDRPAADASVVVITGPTGSGKSRIALELASRLGAEIVNADSIQLRKDFNIGASKPRPEEMQRVPHHLFSVVSALDEVDAERYRRAADEAIRQVAARGHLPLIVGGSGMYLQALLCGFVETSVAPAALESFETRLRAIEACTPAAAVSAALHEWLAQLDPNSAAALHPNDRARIRRALLIALSGRDSLHDLQRTHAFGTARYRALVIALMPERQALYQAINHRVDRMFTEGLIAEVTALRATYPRSCAVFRSIGYDHVCRYLEGEIDYPRMVEEMKRDTRRFAKRQRTWWRSRPGAWSWDILSREDFEQSGASSALDPAGEIYGKAPEKNVAAVTHYLADLVSRFLAGELPQARPQETSEAARFSKRVAFIELPI